MKTLWTRFDAKVDRSGGPDACWPWTASLGTGGYGQLGPQPGEKAGSYKAHRLAYEFHTGRAVAVGMELTHTCGKRRCCNPTHIVLKQPIPLSARLDPKIDKSGGPDACWPWTASRDARGYGQIRCTVLKRPLKAHRVALEAHTGQPIPDGMNVCHRCDNPPCCNPSHLFIGTQSDNMQDCSSKGRHPGPGMRGADHPIARLSESDVIEIRRLYETTMAAQTELGRRFGVGQATISSIVLRKSWTHI